MKNSSVIGYGLALSAILLWSVHAITVRYLVYSQGIDPNLISFLRLFLGGTFLCIISLIFIGKDQFKSLIVTEKIYKNPIFLLTGLFLAVFYYLFQFGFKYTFATDGILMINLSPVAVVLLTLLLFPQRLGNLHNAQRLFVLVCFACLGAVFILSASPDFNGVLYGDKLHGDIIELIAVLFYSLFLIFNYELERRSIIGTNYSGLVMTSLILTLASIFLLPFLFISFGSLHLIQGLNLILVLLISIGSTGIAYAFWFSAAKYLNIVTLSLLFIVPGIITMVVESLLYGNINLFSFEFIAGVSIMFFVSIYVEFFYKS